MERYRVTFCPDGWKIWPADRAGGVLTADRIEIFGVKGTSDREGLIIEGVIKVNGILWMGGQSVKTEFARIQPATSVVKVGPARMRAVSKT